MPPEASRNLPAILFVAAIAAIGIYLLLAGSGVFGQSRSGAPGWVIAIAGAAFLLAAGSKAVGIAQGMSRGLPGSAPDTLRVVQILLSLGIVALFAVVATWAAFDPGSAGSTGHRIAFGAGAILCWTIFIGFAIWKLRRLRR